ncbi:hypothetical protein PYCC9005_005058 [Savitreella phatthalungensis]
MNESDNIQALRDVSPVKRSSPEASPVPSPIQSPSAKRISFANDDQPVLKRAAKSSFDLRRRAALELEERLSHRHKSLECLRPSKLMKMDDSSARVATDTSFIDFAPVIDLALTLRLQPDPMILEPSIVPRSSTEIQEHRDADQDLIDAHIRRSAAAARHFVRQNSRKSSAPDASKQDAPSVKPALAVTSTSAPASDVSRSSSRSKHSWRTSDYCRGSLVGYRRSTIEQWRPRRTPSFVPSPARLQGGRPVSGVSAKTRDTSTSTPSLSPDDSVSNARHSVSASTTTSTSGCGQQLSRGDTRATAGRSVITETSDVLANLAYMAHEQSLGRIQMLESVMGPGLTASKTANSENGKRERSVDSLAMEVEQLNVHSSEAIDVPIIQPLDAPIDLDNTPMSNAGLHRFPSSEWPFQNISVEWLAGEPAERRGRSQLGMRPPPLAPNLHTHFNDRESTHLQARAQRVMSTGSSWSSDSGRSSASSETSAMMKLMDVAKPDYENLWQSFDYRML